MTTQRNPRIAKLYKEHRHNTDTLYCDGCGFRAPELPGQPGRELWTRLFHAHHVVPLRCGGADEGNNLSLLCLNCHAIVHAVHTAAGGVWSGPATPIEQRGNFIFWWAMGWFDRMTTSVRG